MLRELFLSPYAAVLDGISANGRSRTLASVGCVDLIGCQRLDHTFRSSNLPETHLRTHGRKRPPHEGRALPIRTVQLSRGVRCLSVNRHCSTTAYVGWMRTSVARVKLWGQVRTVGAQECNRRTKPPGTLSLTLHVLRAPQDIRKSS